MSKREEWWEEDAIYHLREIADSCFETDEYQLGDFDKVGKKMIKELISKIVSQARLKERDRIVKWLIKQELPEVTCHQNHRDLVAGYNQALLKVRRYILAQLKTKKKE